MEPARLPQRRLVLVATRFDTFARRFSRFTTWRGTFAHVVEAFVTEVESSQVPMFRLLGTAGDHKRHVVEDGSHFVARSRLIQEVLAWLDKYQPSRESETR